MPLDTYSKLLILVDFLALFLLIRYLEYTLILVPFGLLLLILWVWLYRIFSPLAFAWPALVSVLAAVGLYVPNPYVRATSLAFVIPAIAAAFGRLLKPEPEIPGRAGGS